MIDHGYSTRQETEPVSTLNGYLDGVVTDNDESSLYLDSDARHFNLGPYH